MTTKQIKKIEKIANQSLVYAKKAIKKSNELYAALSLIEFKTGKKNRYSSIDDLFEKFDM